MAFNFPLPSKPHLLFTGGLGGEIGIVRRGIEALIRYIDQPAARTVPGDTDTILASDIGGVVAYAHNSTVTIALPSLAARARPNSAMLLTFQATNAAGALVVDPGAGVTIDGVTTNLTADVGLVRVSLLSLNGVDWFSGRPS
jgi:hypothetical protein